MENIPPVRDDTSRLAGFGKRLDRLILRPRSLLIRDDPRVQISAIFCANDMDEVDEVDEVDGVFGVPIVRVGSPRGFLQVTRALPYA